MTQSKREAFERDMLAYGYRASEYPWHPAGHYIDDDHNMAFIGWKAASASKPTPPASTLSEDEAVEIMLIGIAKGQGREHELDDSAHVANYRRDALSAYRALLAASAKEE